MNYLTYIKSAIILIAVCASIWFYKDYIDKSAFKKDTENNQAWSDKLDSLRISYIVLTDKQMIEHLSNDKKTNAILKENNIKLAHVTSIMNHVLKYRDTTIVRTDFSDMITAINERKPYKQPFKDSTDCMVLKGFLEYQPGTIEVDEFGGLRNGSHASPLSFSITERSFDNETTAVAYWQHRQWKFLGIKTRLFGKKEATAKVVDKCGKSQIINIEKAK
jgi:hypothetical protein